MRGVTGEKNKTSPLFTSIDPPPCLQFVGFRPLFLERNMQRSMQEMGRDERERFALMNEIVHA